MNKIILGLDMDGVLYDWHSAAYTYYQYMKGYAGDYREFWTTFINDTPKEEQDYLVSLPFLYHAITPSPIVSNFLKEVSKLADIFYITSRPQTSDIEHATRKYIQEYEFPFPDNLFITNDKVTVCRYTGVTHFLDDNAQHVKKVSETAKSYLLAKYWNQYAQDELDTVHGLYEFKERVFS